MKEKIIKELKDYKIKEQNNNLEIINSNGPNMTINIEDELIVEFDEWHSHYQLEDQDDFEIAMDEIKNILENKQSILCIYINNISFASGTTFNKDKYTEEDVLDFLKTFLKSYQLRHPLQVKIKYWDSKKNYELAIKGGN